jgi:hypothetical protein
VQVDRDHPREQDHLYAARGEAEGGTAQIPRERAVTRRCVEAYAIHASNPHPHARRRRAHTATSGQTDDFRHCCRPQGHVRPLRTRIARVGYHAKHACWSSRSPRRAGAQLSGLLGARYDRTSCFGPGKSS